jgi:predicted lipoprotein
MNAQVSLTTNARPKPRLRLVVASALVLVLVAAMALDTKIVKMGSPGDAQPNVFSPDAYGETEFPKIQAGVEARAVAADVLAAAIAADKDAAAKQYGIPGGIGPEMSVKFAGVAGTGKSGVYPVSVAGLPNNLTIRVQTGPAINGTDLRDATGTITFEQFTNQIEYQNAGSALNKEMKKQVLSKIDNSNLTGKTLSVVGVFQMINPNSWLVTPVKLDVQ